MAIVEPTEGAEGGSVTAPWWRIGRAQPTDGPRSRRRNRCVFAAGSEFLGPRAIGISLPKFLSEAVGFVGLTEPIELFGGSVEGFR